eukprot:CAMPEP_0179249054 /NCGR_PEP_ID=MMETSP0797-20121207/20450_1 /TAXON_ID=47934 /ORGANISM="Dinophysis acuminata, Strain DAEP01" /LENGTH=58 /DNA_ID=CAMNT_0020956739 /DNA_START=123 /DNA_END=296 /DNA_ORIENTATION=-
MAVLAGVLARPPPALWIAANAPAPTNVHAPRGPFLTPPPPASQDTPRGGDGAGRLRPC